MPNLLQFDLTQSIGFIYIFIRITGVMTIAPIFGDSNIPPLVKITIALLISLIFFPVVAAPQVGADPNVADLVYTALLEFGVGLLMGFSTRLLFTAVGLAGEVAGYQMGLGIANIFDPTSQTQTSLIGQINVIFALLLFVVLDGHHLLIVALADSYRILPVGAAKISPEGMRFYVDLVGNLFLVGLRLGAPIIVALMAANFSMGLITRSVPQLNVIIVGIPFTIGLGIIFMIIGFPYFIQALVLLNEKTESILMATLKALG